MNRILRWFLIIIGILIVIIIIVGLYFHIIPGIFFVSKMKDGTLTGEKAFLKTVGEGEGFETGAFSGPSFVVNNACKPGLKAIGDAIYTTGGPLSGCAYPMCGCYICTKCGDGICGKGENHCNCKEDCKEGEGVFVESDDPKITSMGTMGSTLEIGGKVKEDWFSEGQLPVKLLDAKGNLISEGVAVTKKMTEGWVSFEASFPDTDAKSGSLLFSKDNPSGLPQNDMSVSIPFSF